MDEIELLKQENSRLSKELEDKSFELAVLYDISNNISYTLDYDNFLQFMMDSLHRIIDYDLCTSLIILEEEKKAKMVVRLAHPVNSEIIEGVKQKVLLALNSLRGESLSVEDVLFHLSGELTECSEARGEKIKSSFDVPLFVDDVAVGIMNVASFKEIQYTDDKLRLFYTVASQASSTIARLQAVLSAEKSKMNIMVKRMSEGVVMFDEKDELVILNASAKEMLGCPEKELDTKELLGFLQKIDLIQSLDEIKKQKGASWIKDLALEVPEQRVIHTEAVYILDDAEKPLGIAMVLRDVTKEREIEQMKNDFVSLVSHELRTPMAAMKGATDNMLDGLTGDLNAVQKDCLGIVKRNIDRLNRLIADLLDIARIESGKIQINKQPVDMVVLIKDVMQLFKENAKLKNIELITSFSTDLLMVEVDSDKITQVLTNLVGNAMKFTPESGKISVVLTKSDEFLQVDVVDTGLGISQKDLEKVFDKFYQVANIDSRTKTKGTGLGLPICKGIIEKHNGNIWVESVLGKGSKFIFTLPLGKTKLS